MPALLLQKPSSKSKAKEHTLHLERRLKFWLEGKLDELVHEGRTIQRQLTRNLQRQQKSDDGTARIFSKLMMEGKVRAALRLVTQTNGCGSLPLNNLANSNYPTRAQTVFHNSSTSTVIRLYITLVRPILEYCAVIWDPSSPSLSYSLDSVQRFTIKLASKFHFSLVAFIHSYFKLSSLATHHQHAKLIFLFKFFHTTAPSSHFKSSSLAVRHHLIHSAPFIQIIFNLPALKDVLF